MRVVRLYFRLLSVHIRVLLEYQADFWVMAGATLLTQVVNLVFLSAVFAKVPTLNGWSYWAIVAMFGIVALAEGVGSLFFEGMWRIAEYINLGTLDYLVVRPYPIVAQVSSAEVGINGLTNIITGGLMLAVAMVRADISWSIGRVLLAVVFFVSGIAIKVAINLATNAVSFWLSSPSPIFAIAVHQVGDLAKFPLSIYPTGLKLVMGVAVPFAFISAFPIGFLTDAGRWAWLGLLTPLVAVYCVAVALFVFKRGLRRYESAGN
jgi:viologen exporter family transport system permease protein